MQAVTRGYYVVGFDPDEARVKRLNVAESDVDDVRDGVLQRALASGRYRATN
jgi:UDP-N-acetyl-D-glucosamine dehydrogenase